MGSARARMSGLCLAVLGASGGLSATARAADTLQVTFETQAGTPTGWTCFTPRHIVAAWLEDDATGFHAVTLSLWGKSFLNNLKDWVESSSFVIDGLTAATQICDTGKVADQNDANGDGCSCGTSCATVNLPSQLDTTAVDISDLPDGTYRLLLEASYCELANSFVSSVATFTFNKNGSSSSLTPSNQAVFRNVHINYVAARGGGSPPGVIAGPNQVIAPSATATRTTTLQGIVSDDGGAPTSTWSQVSSDPAGGVATFDDANDPTTSVSFSRAGLYVLRLTATDGVLSTADDVTITVNARELVAQADATVDSANTTRAFGVLVNDANGARGHQGNIIGSDAQSRQRYYVRFDTTPVTGTVIAAKLRLGGVWAPVGCTPLGGHWRNVYVLSDDDDTFTESNITWSNQPLSSPLGVPDANDLYAGHFDANPAASASYIPTWYVADLDLAVTFASANQTNGTMTFYLRPDPGDSNPCALQVTSRESYLPPTLVVIEGWQAAPNQPPVAAAGSDQVAVDADGNGSQSVILDGSASSDPDGTVTAWDWREGGASIATGAVASVVLPLGVHDLTLRVTDSLGDTATDVVQVIVDDRFSGNDTAASARSMTGSPSGSTYAALMAYQAFGGGGGDWFAVTLPAPADLSANVAHTHADGDLDLRLVQSDGTTVLDASTTTGDSETVAATGLAAGTYLLNVSAAGGVSDANVYSLVLTLTGLPALSVLLTPASAPESGGTLTAAGSAVASVAPASDLTVSLSSDGAGLVVPAQVTIPSGQSSTPFDLTLVDDAIANGDRAVTITATAAGHIGGSGVFTLVDDDGGAGPVANWTQPTLTVREDAGMVSFRALLSTPAAATVTLPYTVSGTATPGVDHTLADGAVTISGGQNERGVAFSVVADAEGEGDETIVVTMGAPTNAVAGVNTVLVITLQDLAAGADGGPTGDTDGSAQILKGQGCGCRARGGSDLAVGLLALALLRVRRSRR